MKFTPVVIIPCLVGLSASLGINCRGSGGCTGSGTIGVSGTRLSNLKNQIDKIDDDKHFDNGDHLACEENKLGTGICAFYQNTGSGGSGSEAKGLIQKLINHGCTACGSVPTGKGNDVSHGQLTVNYVSKP